MWFHRPLTSGSLGCWFLVPIPEACPHLLNPKSKELAHKQAAWMFLLHIHFQELLFQEILQCSLQRGVLITGPERNQNFVKHLRSVEVWFLISPLVSLLALLCLHMVPSALNSIVLTANWLSLKSSHPQSWIHPAWTRGHPCFSQLWSKGWKSWCHLLCSYCGPGSFFYKKNRNHHF